MCAAARQKAELVPALVQRVLAASRVPESLRRNTPQQVGRLHSCSAPPPLPPRVDENLIETSRGSSPSASTRDMPAMSALYWLL